MISKVTITYFVLMIMLINLAQTRFTEVPPPPKRPDYFRSKEELRRYLQKAYEYHLIVDRWRFRRNSDDHPFLTTSDDDLFRFFDTNNDHYITKHEFTQRLRFKKE